MKRISGVVEFYDPVLQLYRLKPPEGGKTVLIQKTILDGVGIGALQTGARVEIAFCDCGQDVFSLAVTTRKNA